MTHALSRLRAGRFAAVLALPIAFALPVAAQTTTMIVMDGSGSMWGQIDGRPKLEIARDTVAQVLTDLPDSRVLGLMAYGHRERGNCADIEVMVPPAAGSAAAIQQAVNGMRFQGKTPLTEAVRQAAEALRSTEEPATVILVTDGIETCEADPCALATELQASGVDFTAHVIGFGLTRDEGAEVACIAQNTGGRYFEAKDSAALAEALNAAVTEEASEAAPPAAPPPQRRYFPGAPMMEAIALMPTGQTTGQTAGQSTGAPEGILPDFGFPADGTAPQCAALCEAEALCAAWRYEPVGSHFLDHARCFGYLASSEMDYNTHAPEEGWGSGIKDGVLMLVRPYIPVGPLPEASLTAPDTAAIGQPVLIGWTGPAAELDTVEIGLPGDGERWSWDYVAKGNPLSLIMPGEPGAYELRYKYRDEVVIATRSIIVLEGPVTLTAPAQVLAGAEIAVGWSGPNAPYDNIQIAEAGSDSYISYAYVTDGNPLRLTAPEQPGRYELRYKLSDTEVIASRPFEVLAAGSTQPPETPSETPSETPPEPASALVPVTLRTAPAAPDPVSWSATPLDPAPETAPDTAPEAVAMPEAFAGPWQAELSPGRWRIEGLAESGMAYTAEITVTEAAGQVFDIPVGFESDGMGEDAPAIPASPGTAPLGSPVTDAATGLSLSLPEGWHLTEAFRAETAAGVAATAPTATFTGPDGRMIVLNPLQWLESNGPCQDSPLGPLCVFGTADEQTTAAMALILSSLSLDRPGPDLGGPDLGGTPFTPQGSDPMSTLVPGWSAD